MWRECNALDSRHNCVAGFSRVWIWYHVKVMLSKVCVGGVDYYIGSVFIGALWWNSRGWWASPWWRIMHGQRTHTDARIGADVAMPGPTTDYRTTSSKNIAQVTLTRLIFRRASLGASLFSYHFLLRSFCTENEKVRLWLNHIVCPLALLAVTTGQPIMRFSWNFLTYSSLG